MSEIIVYIFVFMIAVIVLAPLFRSRHVDFKTAPLVAASLNDWLYQKRVATEIIGDLDFDHQTGKLNDEDYTALKSVQKLLVDELDGKIRDAAQHPRDEITKKLNAEIDKAKIQLAEKFIFICNHCGHREAKVAKFCSQCGTKLS